MTDKPDLTLYLGGTRSGKSARAEAAALQAQGPVLYVATAEARADDASMLDRIRRHRARRPAHWRTLECPCRLAESIAAALASAPFAPGAAEAGRVRPTILVDCVTLWVSNILFSLPDPEDLEAFETAVRAEVDALLALMERSACRKGLLLPSAAGLRAFQRRNAPRSRAGRNSGKAMKTADRNTVSRPADSFNDKTL